MKHFLGLTKLKMLTTADNSDNRLPKTIGVRMFPFRPRWQAITRSGFSLIVILEPLPSQFGHCLSLKVADNLSANVPSALGDSKMALLMKPPFIPQFPHVVSKEITFCSAGITSCKRKYSASWYWPYRQLNCLQTSCWFQKTK